MRPPQDPATIAKAKEQDWYIEFDDINAKARNVLEKYSGIAPADVVPRVKEIVSLPFLPICGKQLTNRSANVPLQL